jgi:hypothetical protein
LESLFQYNFFFILYLYLFLLLNFFKKNRKLSIGLNKILLLIGVVVNSLFIGLRNFSVGSDTQRYLQSFKDVQIRIEESSIFNDILFYYLSYFVSLVSFNEYFFLIFFSFLYHILLFRIAYLLDNQKWMSVLLLILSSFVFIDFSLNILKAGLATLFCILVLASKWKYKFIYFILALSIHFSSILFIICYYLSKKLSLTISIIFWFTSLIISYFNISGSILEILIEKFNFTEVLGIVRYLEGNDLSYKVGFRIDFVAYSILPFILMFISKKVFKNKALINHEMASLYLLLNGLFMLMFHIPFSNRIGYYSWALMPLILFDFEKENQKRIVFVSLILMLISIVIYIK